MWPDKASLNIQMLGQYHALKTQRIGCYRVSVFIEHWGLLQGFRVDQSIHRVFCNSKKEENAVKFL